jgi:hypothetical protein
MGETINAAYIKKCLAKIILGIKDQTCLPEAGVSVPEFSWLRA